MTAFDDLFSSIASPCLLDLHGEEVVYLPAAGLPREVTAIVVREPHQSIEPLADGVAPLLVVKVLNDPEDPSFSGIAVSEIDTGGDLLRIAWRKGDDPEERSITKLIGVKGGMTVFEVR